MKLFRTTKMEGEHWGVFLDKKSDMEHLAEEFNRIAKNAAKVSDVVRDSIKIEVLIQKRSIRFTD